MNTPVYLVLPKVKNLNGMDIAGLAATPTGIRSEDTPAPASAQGAAALKTDGESKNKITRALKGLQGLLERHHVAVKIAGIALAAGAITALVGFNLGTFGTGAIVTLAVGLGCGLGYLAYKQINKKTIQNEKEMAQAQGITGHGVGYEKTAESEKLDEDIAAQRASVQAQGAGSPPAPASSDEADDKDQPQNAEQTSGATTPRSKGQGAEAVINQEVKITNENSAAQDPKTRINNAIETLQQAGLSRADIVDLMDKLAGKQPISPAAS